MASLQYRASRLNYNFSDDLKSFVFHNDWFRFLITDAQTVYKTMW